jgi:hypothetical protein
VFQTGVSDALGDKEGEMDPVGAADRESDGLWLADELPLFDAAQELDADAEIDAVAAILPLTLALLDAVVVSLELGLLELEALTVAVRECVALCSEERPAKGVCMRKAH